jgi:hypothetical protein
VVSESSTEPMMTRLKLVEPRCFKMVSLTEPPLGNSSYLMSTSGNAKSALSVSGWKYCRLQRLHRSHQSQSEWGVTDRVGTVRAATGKRNARPYHRHVTAM